MRTLRKPGDIHVGSPFMVTDSRLTDEHYAIYGDLVRMNAHPTKHINLYAPSNLRWFALRA